MKRTDTKKQRREKNPEARLAPHTAGDKDLFSDLIAEHGESLTKYCRFLTGSKMESEDLLQETWLRAWSVYREQKRSWNRSYLRSIAYHAWIDRLRKKGKETEKAMSNLLREEPESDPLRLWSASERIVRTLTPEQRTIYLLMEYLRFTAAETSQLLGTTEGGVKASLHRARRKLDDRQRGDNEARDLPADIDQDEAGERTVFAYLEAIRLQDVRALLLLRNGGSADEASGAARCAVRLGSAEVSGRTNSLVSGAEKLSLFCFRAAA
ncbi:sigma-70 family RNA polymerase sigma factor [Saccharibacillus deserti]|uniref:sigma-70 family RNA polymerase sigma factor n=1 Tax=Saccharibacillus deserti TaxID=1634444 RepID=UPI0015552099